MATAILANTFQRLWEKISEKAPDMSNEEITILILEFTIRNAVLDCDQRTVESNREKS